MFIAGCNNFKFKLENDCKSHETKSQVIIMCEVSITEV